MTLSLPPSRGHRNGVTLARIRGLRLAPGARVSLQLRLQRARLLALERPHRRRLALRLRLDTVVAGIATARTIPVTVRLPARRR